MATPVEGQVGDVIMHDVPVADVEEVVPVVVVEEVEAVLEPMEVHQEVQNMHEDSVNVVLDGLQGSASP